MSQQIELSRGQLLTWLNTTTRSNYIKVQQLGSGVAYCQLFQILHPGKLPSNRINFKAKTQYEFICNLKLLQQALFKAGVARQIDIERLIKCRYQDNFQLLQWWKGQFEACGRRVGGEVVGGGGVVGRQATMQSRKEDSRMQATTNRSNVENSQGSFHRGNNVSFQEVLVELNRPPEVDDAALRQDRNFYLMKLKDIDHLVETWDRNRPTQQLANTIKFILAATPDKIYNINNGLLTEADDDLI